MERIDHSRGISSNWILRLNSFHLDTWSHSPSSFLKGTPGHPFCINCRLEVAACNMYPQTVYPNDTNNNSKIGIRGEKTNNVQKRMAPENANCSASAATTTTTTKVLVHENKNTICFCYEVEYTYLPKPTRIQTDHNNNNDPQIAIIKITIRASFLQPGFLLTPL